MTQAQVIADINAQIYTNGVEAITGSVLNTVLQNMYGNVLQVEMPTPTLTNSAIALGDTMEVMFGKLQAQINSNVTAPANGLQIIGGTALGLGGTLSQATTINGGVNDLVIGTTASMLQNFELNAYSTFGIASNDGVNQVNIFGDISSNTITMAYSGLLNNFVMVTDTLVYLQRQGGAKIELAGTYSLMDDGSGTNIFYSDANGNKIYHAVLNNFNAPLHTFTGDISMLTGMLTLFADPTSSMHAATKNYVDNSIAGLKFKQDCRVVATNNVNIAFAPASTDGVTLSVGDRILLVGQTTQTENGSYLYAGAGNPLTRTTDADTGVEIASKTFPVKEGTAYADTWWTVTNDTVTVGVTNIVFTQTAGAGTYTAGTGLSLVGNLFTVDSTVARWAAPITTTQIAFSDGTNLLGSASYTWDNTNSRLKIGTVAQTTTFDRDLIISKSASNVGIGIFNSDLTANSIVYLGESNTNIGYFARYGSTKTGNYGGAATTIPFANSFHVANATTGSFGTGRLVTSGSEIIALIGQTAGNYGTRLDANGLYIGLSSALHTSNTYPFSVNGKFYWDETNTRIAVINTGAAYMRATSALANFIASHSGGLSITMQADASGSFLMGSSNTYIDANTNQIFLRGTTGANIWVNGTARMTFSTTAAVVTLPLTLGILGSNTGDLTITNGSNGSGSDFGTKILFNSPIFGGMSNSHIAQIRASGNSDGSASNSLQFHVGNWNNNATVGAAKVTFLQRNSAVFGVGIGTTTPLAGLHSLMTTEQLRLGYDATNWMGTVVGSTGITTYTLNGTNPYHAFSNGYLVIANGGTPVARNLTSVGIVMGSQASSDHYIEWKYTGGTAFYSGMSGGNYTIMSNSVASCNFNVNRATGLITSQVTSTASLNEAHRISLLAGGTDASAYVASQVYNNAAGTGTNLKLATGNSNPLGNVGITAFAKATTTGYNMSFYGEAFGGNINIGVLGKAITAKNGATNIGVLGVANNTGTTPVIVGGYFGIGGSDTPTFVSAVIYAAAGTAAIPNVILATTAYTGTTNGALWNDGTYFASYNPYKSVAYSGTGDRVVMANATGEMTAGVEAVDQWLTVGGTAALLLENTANWTGTSYTGTAITGTYQGQTHKDATYFFIATADNVWKRVIWS